MSQRQDPWTDDLELVAHILRGSTEHRDILYEAYFPRVYRFAQRRLRDPAQAEDVTLEVFFTVFDTLDACRWRLRAGIALARFLDAANHLSPILGALVPDAAAKRLRRLDLKVRARFPSSLSLWIFHLTRDAVYRRLGGRIRFGPPRGGKPIRCEAA